MKHEEHGHLVVLDSSICFGAAKSQLTSCPVQGVGGHVWAGNRIKTQLRIKGSHPPSDSKRGGAAAGMAFLGDAGQGVFPAHAENSIEGEVKGRDPVNRRYAAGLSLASQVCKERARWL